MSMAIAMHLSAVRPSALIFTSNEFIDDTAGVVWSSHRGPFCSIDIVGLQDRDFATLHQRRSMPSLLRGAVQAVEVLPQTDGAYRLVHSYYGFPIPWLGTLRAERPYGGEVPETDPIQRAIDEYHHRSFRGMDVRVFSFVLGVLLCTAIVFALVQWLCALFVAARGLSVQQRRALVGCCEGCGYALSDQDMCPECGRAIDHKCGISSKNL